MVSVEQYLRENIFLYANQPQGSIVVLLSSVLIIRVTLHRFTQVKCSS